MATRGHLTAGDLSPIQYGTEITYGTAVNTGNVYGEVAADGNFQPTDNPHPHLAFKYGQRTFNQANYVTQQHEAGYQAVFEAADDDGMLLDLLGFAHATSGNALPSRTVAIRAKEASNAIKYVGCKTEELVIRADEPGEVVKFEETVFASYSEAASVSVVQTPTPAIQWTGGVILGNSTCYPQSFKLTVRNNLGRVYGYDNTHGSITKALLEGREEIDFEMDLWMEDFSYLLSNMTNATVSGTVVIRLGIAHPVDITLSGLSYVADGSNTALVQDKQKQTVRFRAQFLSKAAVA